MKNKIFKNFDDAIADIPDGATIMMFFWGVAGTPQNLIRTLRDKGIKDLTLISHNFIPGFLGDHLLIDKIITPFALVNQIKKLITAWPGTGTILGIESPLAKLVKEGAVELEITSHGVLVERIRAGGGGIGGFYSPVGVGTVLEEGKEKRVIDGKEFILEKPLKAQFGFIRAYKADKRGNLIYRGSGRGCNPIIAMASDITIAEVDEIVEVGKLDPEIIVTPGIFVDRIVKIPDGGLSSYSQRAALLREVFQGG